MNAITIIFIVILAAIVIRLVSKAVSNDKKTGSRNDDFHSPHMWNSFGHDERRYSNADGDTDRYTSNAADVDSSSYDSDCGGGGDCGGCD